MSSLVQKILPLLLISVMLSGCVNLRHVNEFSTEAITGLEQFEEFSYSFAKSCKDRCLDVNVKDLKVNSGQCECDLQKRADSITLLIYNASHGYFEGLSDLSNNELTNINTTALSQTLAEGDFGPISLNAEQASAYSSLGTTLLRALTDGYRRDKLKTYVRQANGPLQVLLEYLDLNLSGNLKQKLEVRKLNLQDFYFDLAADPKLSTYEKTKFVEDYYNRVAEIETEQEKLLTYSETLKVIAEGHEWMTEHIDQLKGDDLRVELARYGSDLHNIITGFNTLTR